MKQAACHVCAIFHKSPNQCMRQFIKTAIHKATIEHGKYYVLILRHNLSCIEPYNATCTYKVTLDICKNIRPYPIKHQRFY